MVAVFLCSAVTITALSQTHLSVNWFFADGQYPLISCPSSHVMIGYNEDVDGPFCKLFMSFANPSALIQDANIAIFVSDGELQGSGVYDFSCGSTATMISQCRMLGWADSYPSPPTTGCVYNAAPVCDSAGNVYVGQIVNLRGLFLGSGLIAVIYFFMTALVLLNLRTALIPMRQRRIDAARNFADASAKEMTKIVEREWNQFEFDHSVAKRRPSRPSFPSLVAETGHLRGGPPSGPRDLFGSEQWRVRVRKSLGQEARARRHVSTAQMKIQFGLVNFFVYFGFFVGVTQIILISLPDVYSKATVRGVISVLLFQVELLSAIFTAGTTWIDFIVICDTLVSLLLLAVSVGGIVQWPALQVKVPHMVKIRTGIRRGVETDFAQAAADGAIYAETVCAVVVCRESCSSEARRQTLVKRLQNLLTMFPPDSIFLVDSHPKSVVPVDPTWQIGHSVSPAIKYCFVPDCESRGFAVHWFNAVWLPFLARSGQAQAFTHILLLGAVDDEGSLPQVPLDISIPRENLFVNMDNLRALHLPVGAMSSSTSCCLVPCQDLEMKHRALLQLAQSRIGSATEVETVAGIWERDALFHSLSQANGASASLAGGLSVVKLRGRNHVGSMPHTFVSVSVPLSFTDLATQKILTQTSIQVTRMGVALRELFSVFSLCNLISWSAKPWLLLGTVVGGFVEMARPLVVATLIFRDPLSIAGLAVIACILLLSQEILLLLVFANRPDLRAKWTLAPILLFPVYRCVVTWFVDLAALFDFILGGSVRTLTLRPDKRAKELNDIPACPPFYVVNWFSVWVTEEEDGESTKEPSKALQEEDEDSADFQAEGGRFQGLRRGG